MKNGTIIAGLTHAALVERAVRWLRGTRRCDPVLAGIASLEEVPDAMGWSSHYAHQGSTLVECKTSRRDFLADKAKKYGPVRMGRYRFFLVPPGIVTVADVAEHYPDHGLLEWRGGRLVRELVAAPERAIPDLVGETVVLRFALLHARANLERRGVLVDLTKASKLYGGGVAFRELDRDKPMRLVNVGEDAA